MSRTEQTLAAGNGLIEQRPRVGKPALSQSSHRRFLDRDQRHIVSWPEDFARARQGFVEEPRTAFDVAGRDSGACEVGLTSESIRVIRAKRAATILNGFGKQ
jgi:hypothetical protein